MRLLVLSLFPVMAAPAAACSVAASALSFGHYDPGSSRPRDGAGGVRIRCPSPTALTVGLGPGQDGSVLARRLRNGGAPAALAYSLHPDPSRTRIWGDGSGGTVTVDALASDTRLPLYGRIAAGQSALPGVYSDVVTVTVSF